jgi:hypothetical protein
MKKDLNKRLRELQEINKLSKEVMIEAIENLRKKVKEDRERCYNNALPYLFPCFIIPKPKSIQEQLNEAVEREDYELAWKLNKML